MSKDTEIRNQYKKDDDDKLTQIYYQYQSLK